MFFAARTKLTLLYSLIFLSLFWVLSWGVYAWMNGYFGDRQRNTFDAYCYNSSRESPSDMVMDELRTTLFLIDGILLFAVPGITWFLAKKTLAPIQDAHEREKQFFTDASHDLRTPLTILKGETELTLEKERTINEYKNTLLSNKEEIDKLIALVDNMLFFSRDGKINIKKTLIDLTDTIKETVKRFQKLALRKKQNLTFVPQEESIIVFGNQQLVQRLFMSLFDNAIKYTPEKGNIKILLSHEKHRAVVSITDTGIGMSDKQQKKVFDRFYRGDMARSQNGFGLGLAIVKRIIAFHQGKITLHSKEGKGTQITITLPLFTRSQEKNLS